MIIFAGPKEKGQRKKSCEPCGPAKDLLNAENQMVERFALVIQKSSYNVRLQLLLIDTFAKGENM